ncbi:hypothetical protein FRC12_007602 [Ceratobasidium sp. 428]|nr:hypothetical protein FRC12_007602 [Ceratobasidium sp. 428]
MRAIAAYEAKQLTFEQLQREMDASCTESIRRMEDAGHMVVTDGEQRFSPVATYPIMDTLNGTGISENLVSDGQYFAMQVRVLSHRHIPIPFFPSVSSVPTHPSIASVSFPILHPILFRPFLFRPVPHPNALQFRFADDYHRRLPRLVSGPFRYKTFAADYLERALPVSQHLLKQAVVAPSMLSLLYPLRSDIPGYTRQQFLTDLCDQCELDIRKCFQAGAVRVSIDFTEGQLTLRNADVRNPWSTSERLLDFFIDLNNRVINRFTAGERAHIGVHTCPGEMCGDGSVSYEDLVKEMFKLNAGYFLIHCASERDRNRVLKLIGKNIRRDANGVKQMAYIGATSAVDPRVESPEEIAQMLIAATKYIPADQLGATDDCGFSAGFCDEKKSKQGMNSDCARDIAFQKIAARVKGARIASERLGI